ncbi:uncharacterized protein LOC120343053 [Styela clava]
MIFILLSILQVSKLASGQCFGETKIESEASGIVKSPGHPGSYYNNDECNWIVNNNLEDYAIAIDVLEIQTSYDGIRKTRCSGSLTINEEKLDCFSSKPFCNLYSTSSKCNKITSSISELSHCIPKSMNDEGVKIQLKTKFFFTLTAQKFKLKYRFFNCSDTDTTKTPKETNAGSKFIRPINEETTISSNTTVETNPAANPNIEAIAVPIMLISLIILLLTPFMLWRRRAKQAFSTKSENPYAEAHDFTNGIDNTNANTDPGTYEVWNGNAQTKYGNNLSIVGNENAAANITQNGIYEDIPVVKHDYMGVDTNLFVAETGYTFADKGYVDIDGKYAMATNMANNDYNDNTQYAFADKGYVDIDNKYAMAINDKNAPLENVYEPSNSEHDLMGPDIPTSPNHYEMAEKEYELVGGQYAMADSASNNEYKKTEENTKEYEIAVQGTNDNENPYELPSSE